MIWLESHYLSYDPVAHLYCSDKYNHIELAVRRKWKVVSVL